MRRGFGRERKGEECVLRVLIVCLWLQVHVRTCIYTVCVHGYVPVFVYVCTYMYKYVLLGGTCGLFL